MTSLADVQNFLAQKRIAIVGVSRNPKELSRALLAEFARRGYDTVAVNPNASDFDGQKCFARIEDVTPAPGAALLMTSQGLLEEVLRDCGKAGIRHIWIYGYGGRSTVSPVAVSELRNAGVGVVNGECPFMFLKGSGGVHRFHGFLRKLCRTYPS